MDDTPVALCASDVTGDPGRFGAGCEVAFNGITRAANFLAMHFAAQLRVWRRKLVATTSVVGTSSRCRSPSEQRPGQIAQ